MARINGSLQRFLSAFITSQGVGRKSTRPRARTEALERQLRDPGYPCLANDGRLVGYAEISPQAARLVLAPSVVSMKSYKNRPMPRRRDTEMRSTSEFCFLQRSFVSVFHSPYQLQVSLLRSCRPRHLQHPEAMRGKRWSCRYGSCQTFSDY